MINFKNFFQKNINEKKEKEDDSLHKSLSKHYKFKSSDHKNNFFRYTQDSYAVNKHLWNKSKGLEDTDEQKEDLNREFAPKIEHLDSGLNLHKTPHPLTVYSGISRDIQKIKDKDGIVNHPAYLSTSLNPEMAKSFGKLQEGNTRHVMKINVPKGHPGAYVGHLSNSPEEREFILPRGTKLKHKETNVENETHPIYENIQVHYHTMDVV